MTCITESMAESMVSSGFYDKKICVICGKEFYCKNGTKKPKHSYGIILRNRNCVTCSNKCVRIKQLEYYR